MNGASSIGAIGLGVAKVVAIGLTGIASRGAALLIGATAIARAGISGGAISTSLARTSPNPNARSARNAKRALAFVFDGFALGSATTCATFASASPQVKF